MCCSLLAALAILLLPAAPASAQSVMVGVSDVGAQRFDNDELPDFVPEVGDSFAWALAAGDFDGDGAGDLATGIAYDDGLQGSPCPDCGLVVVRYGAPGGGLTGGEVGTVLYQGLSGSPDPPEAGDLFGWSLAAGDFDGDGFDDLAVGIPGDRGVGGVAYGAVQVYYGSAGGLQDTETEFLDELLPWTEVPLPFRLGDDEFGAALDAGDFDGDGFDDLAIGAPRAGILVDANTPVRGGEVFVAHGSGEGLLPLLGYGISQHSPGLFGDPLNEERFGRAVAAGDFDADGDDDLAIGVPNEGDNGSLHVILGSPFGLIFADSVFWAPGALGQVPEAGDRLGYALVAADFDGDGHDDLAIGDPSEDLGAANEIADAGSVSVAYGAPGGFDLSRAVSFTQGQVYGDPGADQSGDQFGWALAAGDFDGDGRADLAVGHPGEDPMGIINAGAAALLLGGPGAPALMMPMG
ncbi:MAG: VCBS repeat-containing protein, partial [Thermoanaerobaculia bacterium]